MTLSSAPMADQLAAVALARVRQHKAQPIDPAAWRANARPEQTPPDGDWRSWYLRGGRGGGKTWTGSHTASEWALTYPEVDGAIVAPTYGDARDTCVEGPSGLLAAFGTNRVQVDRGMSRHVLAWNRSIGEVRLRNGVSIFIDGADDGALRIQGKNLGWAWCDEVGLWRNWRLAWEESIGFAVRLAPSRIVATGTPKRGHRLVKRLIDDPTVVKTVVRTLDNADNLNASALEEFIRRYAGTTLGRQELEGEILDDVEGALWTRDLIRYSPIPTIQRHGEIVPDMVRVVIAIDPAVTSGESSDETGIVAVGIGAPDGRVYVLDDLSGRMGALAWARRAIEAYRDLGADRIVAEANNGGDLVEVTLRQIDGNIPVRLVHASRGKRTRAEPVAALYEQGRVVHAKPLEALEDQMCSFTGETGQQSPDRMDALVWAITELQVQSVWHGADDVAVA